MLGSATKLKNARTINETNFDGTGNITTSKWGASRTLALTGAVSGSASVDGSGNVSITTTQANIAVITGELTAEAGKTTSVYTIYPYGYTKSNCVVISFGINTYTSGVDRFKFDDTEEVIESSPLGHGIRFDDDYMYIHFRNNKGSSTTFKYKIVLMKIS